MSFIGLDIGATKINAAVVANEKIRKLISRKTKAQAQQKEIIKQVTDLVDSLITKDVRAIGVGIPGIVDTAKGEAYEVVNIPAWKKVPIKKILEKKYKIPVLVNNDANCFALAEKYFGQGKKYNNIAAITLGSGLGTGLIINGALYNGHSGSAGEFGQIVYKDGIMEQYSGGQFFERQHKINGDKLFEKAKKRDKKALRIFQEYGYHLGKALSMIVNSCDPEIIILGGSVAKSFKFFKKPMEKSLKESVYKRSYSKLNIKISKNTSENIILGATHLISL